MFSHLAAAVTLLSAAVQPAQAGRSSALDTGDGSDEPIPNAITLPMLDVEPGESAFVDIELRNVDEFIFIDTHILFDGRVMSWDREAAPVFSDRSPTLDAVAVMITEDAEELILYDTSFIPPGDDVIIRLAVNIDPDAEPGTYDLSWGWVEAYSRGLWSTEIDAIDGELNVLFPDEDSDGFRADEDCDDEDPEINPDAEDLPGDGIDQDCDGLDAEPDETEDETEDETGDETEDETEDPGGVADPDDQPSFESPDDGDVATAKPGCGCSTATGAGGASWLMLLGFLGLRRRP
jgi:MYXO-CTERM domain-containing protein